MSDNTEVNLTRFLVTFRLRNMDYKVFWSLL